MKKIIVLFLLFPSLLITGLSQQTDIGDTIHAIHYAIHLDEINTDSQRISGFTEIQCLSLVDNLDYIPLQLKDLDIDSVIMENVMLPFNHEEEVVRIELTTPLNTGDTVEVKVFYNGEPFHENWGGFHFSGDYAFNLGVGFVSIPHNLGKSWFPCVDNFTDRATYDFYFRVADNLTAIGGGTLQDTVNNGDGTKTWHWKLDKPIPTYLASVAVGDYRLYSDQYIGVNDTIPITVYARPSEIGKVEGSFVNLKNVMEWFEERFGAYPFGRIGYVGTAIGAMEHATNIAYPHSAINGNTSSESLMVHELAHMWLGDMVTCSTAEDMWLNEGWATFCASLYIRDLYNDQQFMDQLRHEQREVMRKVHITDGGYYALNNIPQEVTYGEHAYNKGGLVAYTLMNYMGEAAFFETVTAYLEHFAFQSVSSGQMEDFMSDYSGIDLDGFFDAWVYTPGTPHFSIDSVYFEENTGQFTADIWLRQKYKGADYLADDNILEITFVDDDFNFYTDTVHFSGATGHSVKEIPFLPKAAFLDLFEKTSDASTENYKYFSSSQEFKYTEAYFKIIIQEISDSALIRVGHHWVAPDSLKMEIPGLRLSPSRYWNIEGVLPDEFKAKGQFTYDLGNYLDYELIGSSNDSIVIMYRAYPGDEWWEPAQTRYGSWDFGVVEVEDLQPGEYTLAVWDKQIVSVEELSQESLYRVYPNPARGEINIEFSRRGKYEIVIYDSLGTRIDMFKVHGKKQTWKSSEKFKSGNVVLMHIKQGDTMLGTEKIIILK